MTDQPTATLNFGGAPLTIASIHQIVYRLCTDGEVSVINCQIDPSSPVRILALMSQKLSSEDRAWLAQMVRAIVHEELGKGGSDHA